MSKRAKKPTKPMGYRGYFLKTPRDILENVHKFQTMSELQKNKVLSKVTRGNTPDCRDKCDCERPPLNVADPVRWKACVGPCSSICPERIQNEYVRMLDRWDAEQQNGVANSAATFNRLQELVRLGADIQSFNGGGVCMLHAAVASRNGDFVRWALANSADLYRRNQFGENAFDILASFPEVEVGRIMIQHGTRDLPWQWFLGFVAQIHNGNVDPNFIEMVNQLDPHIH